MNFDNKLLSWYWYFINERHAIYIRRNRGDDWPWTDDQILMEYKFTNIFRELDTGTIWLRENILEPYALHPELFFNIAMYRLYNYIPTAAEIMEKIGFITSREQLREVPALMYARKKRGERVFTGAHMITGTLGGDKIHQVFELCLGTLWTQHKILEPRKTDNLETAFNRLNKNNPGYGPFISYEVVTDLRHTRYLRNAQDIMTWANPGPGAMRGICRLLGLKVKTRNSGVPSLEIRHQYPTREEYIAYMRKLVHMSVDVPMRKWVPPLEMRDIEHSLCEWDKYERTRNGEGRPRSKYIPPQLRQV